MSIRRHAILVTALILLGCGRDPAASPQPTRPSTPLPPAPSPTATQSPTPTQPTPSGTPRTIPSVTPTLVGSAYPGQAARACRASDAHVAFPPLPDGFPAGAVTDEALSYLNQGGDPARLEAAALASAAGHTPGFRTQVVQSDLTGDDIADVSVASTVEYGGSDPSAGETILMAYICRSGQYVMQSLFERSGAGMRSAGLYAGGGARVVGILDMNGDGRRDIVFGSYWDFDNNPFAEYYIGEWNGDQFVSLIHLEDITGDTVQDINAGWDLTIRDVDGNGTQEMVFGSLPDPATGDTISPAIFAWNGTTFALKAR